MREPQALQEPQPLLTVAEFAAALRLDPSTVYRAAAAGEIRAVRLSEKLGASIRIPASELDRLLGGPEEEMR
jgi:excisionase family DNA binding protein